VPSTGGTGANTLFGLMARQCAAAGIVGTANDDSFAILNLDIPRKKLSIVAINKSGYNYTISTSRRHLTDAPYDMFCIPYSDTFSIYEGSDLRCVTKKEVALQVINNMIENYGSIIYDIQILPFCPIPNVIKMASEKEQINVIELSTLDYSWIEQGENKIGAIFNVTQSPWSDYIQLDNEDRVQITNAKIQNECDKYRLCSPNFNSAFEFSAAKNNGLNGFNIYYTYYPYNPYIQVAPEFNGLYGQTYNDSRGLVCQGDYSLTIVNNSWTEYQLQNKNYLNSFNREIDNMEVQHKIGRIQDIVGGVTGAASGAMLGSMVPGIGTAVGAIVGGATSAVGGAVDYAINEMLRNEALDYKKDQFGYQLDNIKALPFTLSKVSSLTVNNRLFPFVEYYTCTDREKEALANKIAWNGMSVGAIGTIRNYIGNSWSYNNIESKGYIKGKLIRLENTTEDYHIVNAISGELYKGVYIK
jgi:outer membrane lipoprotein SlyB